MRSFWSARPGLAGDLEEVRALILAQAAKDNPEIASAVGHLVGSGGKMLRPALVLLAAGLGAGDRDRVLRAAAAVEMLHMATLVHDDIIDAAPTRRGAATLHALRGARAAVLTGDWLLAACVGLVADLGGIDDARALARIVGRICGSEISQSTERWRPHASVRRDMRRIAGKTAALFALSCYVGGREAGCAAPELQALRRGGYDLGIAFQVIDDLLDFEPADAGLGKPTGTDLSQGIYTLPVVLALRADDGTLARVLARRPSHGRRLAGARSLVESRGGLAGARQVAAQATARARREIAQLPPGPSRQAFDDLACALLERTW